MPKPVVLNFDDDAIVLRKSAKSERSALGHRVNRVGRKRDNRLLNLPVVGVDVRQIFFNLEF